jgi:hypothetical protein
LVSTLLDQRHLDGQRCTLAVGGGILMVNYSSLTVDCGSLTYGGATFAVDSGTLTVDGGTLTAGVGMLAVGGGTLSVDDSTLMPSPARLGSIITSLSH